MINALFDDLEEGGFTYVISHNLEGHITRLFIAHHLSIKLVKSFSNIFMSLLDIIGVSCCNTSFHYGFVFLESEDEDNYYWALHAYKEITGQGNQSCVIMSYRELMLINGINNIFRQQKICRVFDILKIMYYQIARSILDMTMCLIFLCLIGIMLYTRNV
uniref:MULE transposase domain-containing protein n=1 Tax=Lactuca sativa TaxID=4236 RepID=A0A9R1WBX6_LACSA|nr:hypothetical protein LSAT_V11C200082940 [Lactuca sativa]